MTSNTARTIRRHIAAAGYSAQSINKGMAFARNEGAVSQEDGFALAMSRILYSDDQLADGARFNA